MKLDVRLKKRRSCIVLKDAIAKKLVVQQLGRLYGSVKVNKQNMYNLNLWVKGITKMHDNKDRTVAFTL